MSEKTEEQKAAEFAASRRADYVRALEEEREGYLRAGKKDRAAEVDVQLRAARGDVKGRTPAKGDKA